MKKRFDENLSVLFKEQVQLTNVIEYGVSWADLSLGLVKPPPEGARFDLSFEGTLNGEFLNGRIRGTDFLEVRADGKFLLNIYASLITDDGETIAVHEDGVMVPAPGEPVADLFLTMKFSVHSSKYYWLNKTSVWANARVYFNEGRVSVQAYSGSRIPSINLIHN